jgi:hypothetical protein
VPRRLFNLPVAVSLLLCVVTVALWVGSYVRCAYLHSRFCHGHFDGDRQWRGYFLASCRGQLAFELEEIGYPTHPASAPTERWSAEDAVGLRTPTLRGLPFPTTLGFRYAHEYTVAPSGTLRDIRVAIPFWFLLLGSLLYPLFKLLSLLRKRQQFGVCPTCGYDLRATPERCPECGAEASPRAAE